MSKQLKVLELFAGYGSQSISLRDIGVEHEVIGISEIEPDAIISYGAIRYNLDDIKVDKTHDEMRKELMDKNVGWDFQKQKSKIPRMKKDKLEMLYKFDKASNNYGDISIINPIELPDFDYMTYSFPCTDLSNVGKQEGLIRGKTRSGLLYECEKIIETKKPKYLLMENVKNLVGKKFRGQFDEWCNYLERLGYTNYHNNYKVLNAKDFGVPHKRERIFMVSILNNENDFEFPKGFETDIKLKDILETNVDEKYNLKDVKKFFIQNSFNMEHSGNGFRFKPHIKNNADLAYTITTRAGGRMDDNYIVDIESEKDNFEFSIDYISKYVVNKEYHERFLENIGKINVPKGKEVVIVGTTQNKEAKGTNCRHWVHDVNGIVGCLAATDYKQPKQILDLIKGDIAIRKLTPRECFRLMGLSDRDIDKIQSVKLSDGALYKLAGNSIVKQVLDALHKNMFQG